MPNVNPKLIRALLDMQGANPVQQVSDNEPFSLRVIETHPTQAEAQRRLIELQGLGYGGFIDPYGNDRWGWGINASKDNFQPINPKKSNR